MEKRNPPAPFIGVYFGAATMENSMEFPHKTKNGITVWSSSLTPGIHPSETVIQKDTCAPIFIAALFTIVKIWKQSNACQQMNG